MAQTAVAVRTAPIRPEVGELSNLIAVRTRHGGAAADEPIEMTKEKSRGAVVPDA